jgi:hypothetical protein
VGEDGSDAIGLEFSQSEIYILCEYLDDLNESDQVITDTLSLTQKMVDNHKLQKVPESIRISISNLILKASSHEKATPEDKSSFSKQLEKLSPQRIENIELQESLNLYLNLLEEDS